MIAGSGKKLAGIIAEYNPFHAGHRYHIEQTRALTGADYIVVVMSGDFVQRGEPAIVNKYLRAETALRNGADLVIELPFVYATGSAQYFARGAVSQLKQLGCVDYLSFGSESASIQELEQLSELFLTEPFFYKERLQQYLSRGVNYPKARHQAAADFLGEQGIELKEELLSQPNHILALEYVQALHFLQADMKPVAVKRRGSAYHDDSLERGFPSATGIRQAMRLHNFGESLLEGMGENAQAVLSAFQNGESLCWADFMPYLNYQLIYQKDRLAEYYGMNQELANRLVNQYRSGMEAKELIRVLHSKNMTDAAIRRALLHAVTQTIERPYLSNSLDIATPYIRVLGMRREAGELLKAIRENNPNTVIQKPGQAKKLLTDERALWIYEQDIRSSELYEQLCAMKNQRKEISEFERPQIII